MFGDMTSSAQGQVGYEGQTMLVVKDGSVVVQVVQC